MDSDRKAMFVTGDRATHVYDEPGTYFAALRVAAQREANPNTPFARSMNLDRVRVVVTG